jgi:hypothetical protein
MARINGLGHQADSLLMRPTLPPAEPADDRGTPPDEGSPEPEAEGRGEAVEESRPAWPRPTRAAAKGKTRARNLHLTDDVHDRAWQLARQRKATVSAVVNERLDRSLPRWEVKRVN